MGLSRLDNFLKSTRGEILYVDPSSIDSTDSIENKGNSLTRPFKTIQRALIEAARFSYQTGFDNDRFAKTTILLYPGEHLVDNRPGWIPSFEPSNPNLAESVFYKLRDGTSSDDFGPFDINTNFNLASENNALYKMNSIHGGVIIPRGTSIVGLDLRKTKIRPKYVPNPDEVNGANIERSAVFRVTGACYLWQFSIFDADPNTPSYIDYTTNTFFPRFSHHKLTCFEYADGVNPVTINDAFIQNFSTSRTDLDMYYEKVAIAYGESSDRGIQPDYPSSSLQLQSRIDEYLIVGSRGAEVGISSIRAGNGIIPTNTITVDLSEPYENLDIDSPIQIKGIGFSGYNGQQVVSKVISNTQIQYKVQVPPQEPSIPSPPGGTLSLILDTVNSASPYIFNCSLRSVYGMCGLHADGSKAGGFKSMVVAQFTGIGLQKDNKAFVKYDDGTGQYEDELASGDKNIYANSTARYKPAYESYHIKCSNNAFIQVVSVFAIGFTRHFLTESGGDLSITNSNSNFGANSLTASGFRDEAFLRDDVGYITHIIPPREIEPVETSSEFDAIDVNVTNSVGVSTHLYLYNKKDENAPPNYVLDGYRIGAKSNDYLYFSSIIDGNVSEYFAKVVVPGSSESKEKVAYVSRGSENNITDNIINFSDPHPFSQKEKVRVISENGYLPDGIEEDRVYYVVTTGLTANQIKLAKSASDVDNLETVTLNKRGGTLKIVSRVSDKKSGEPGHPIQWESSVNQWYITVSPSGANNTIYNALSTLSGAGILGEATSRTYINRVIDSRSLTDTLYKFRYVIPANSSATSRPPTEGFIIQESNSTIGISNEEVTKQFRNVGLDATLQNVGELRNFRLISNAVWSSSNSTVTITTELAHDLNVGSEVQIKNIKSAQNSTGVDGIGFNGTFIVTEVPTRRTFKYVLNSNPGKFTSNTSSRNVDLPRFSRKKYSGIYSIYKSEEIKKYIRGEQDGVYHLTVINSSNSPTEYPFNEVKLGQPIQNLYPRINRDEPLSDPDSTKSFAVSNPIGKVIVSDPENSLTKETIDSALLDLNVGIKINNITPIGLAGTYFNIETDINHGLNRVTALTILDGGSNYGSGLGIEETYFNAQLITQSSGGIGTEASAKVIVSAAGTISFIEVMDGGSAYQVGDTLSVVGIATTGSHTPATVVVPSGGFYNNTGDNIKISDIVGANYKKFNGVYKISSVGSKNIFVYSTNPIEITSDDVNRGILSAGIGRTELGSSYLSLTGKSLGISTFSYNPQSGITTFVTTNPHGLFKNNKVIISGASANLFNGSFIVDKVLTPSNFSVNVGKTTGSTSTGGSLYLNYDGTSSRGGLSSKDTENVSERMIFNYGNVTTYLLSTVSSTTEDTIIVSNSYDLKIGDFILVNAEIMRIKSTVTSNTIKVFRGSLSTVSQTHAAGSLVRRIKVHPIEFRRNSILRASGHTFEYLGFGPGNYSTAFPERQDRQLTPQEELFAQTTKFGAGSVIFTGMNSNGDFFIGNKKINVAGKGETFDTPIPSITGETQEASVGIEYITPDIVSISKSILVEGGPEADNISKFNGPVIFNEKITSNSLNGIEVNNLLLQGDARISRKFTVGISTPTSAGNPGDVIFDASPKPGGSIGWVYTNGNSWSRFGGINLSESSSIGSFDTLTITNSDLKVGNVGSATSLAQFSINTLGNVGIGTTPDPTASFGKVSLRLNGTYYGDGSGLSNVSDIWVKDSVGIHTNTPIGINVGSAVSEYGLYVGGTVAIDGSLRVSEIIEKATIITNISLGGPGATNIPIYLADNNVYYFTSPASGNWTFEFKGKRPQVDNPATPLDETASEQSVTGDNGFLAVGEIMTVAILTTQGSPAYYNNSIIIDGATITPKYYGGEVVISGNTNGVDVYTYVIVRKSATGSVDQQITVLYSQAQYN